MTDHFEIRERIGWGGTIKNRAGGALIGLILFIGAFPLLWWNEGRLAQNSQTLSQIARDVVPFSVDSAAAPNDNTPLFITATPHVDMALQDPDFGIKVDNALRLYRRAEMYQWQEEKSEQTHDRTGGGSERITSYDYKKIWALGRIDSSHFHKSENYRNPSNPVEEKKWAPKNITLGAYKLDPVWLTKLNNFVVLTPQSGWNPPPPYEKSSDWYYVANDPKNPAIGDIRVRFEYVPTGPLSLIGSVRQNYISPTNPQMLLIAEGHHSSDELIAQRRQEEQTLSWILRLVGFIMMAIGIQGLFVLIGSIGGIIPGFRAIASFFGGIVGVLVALALSTLTIALAWFVARPILTLGLGGAALVCLGLAWQMRKTRNPTGPKPTLTPAAVQRID